MEDRAHIIRTQQVELGLDRESHSAALQDQTGRLCHEKLPGLFEEVIRECIPEKLWVRLNTVVLDLGVIPMGTFETEFPERAKDALRKQLLHLKKETRADQHKTYLSDALEHFLLHGTLPWWIAHPGDNFAEETLSDLLSDNPGELIRLIRKIGRKSQVRKRLAWQFSEPTLIRLIEKLEPANARLIIEYAEKLQQKQEKERVTNAENKAFRKATWEFILHYLLHEKGSYFNTRAFLRSLITQLAGHYNLSYLTLLTHLALSPEEIGISPAQRQSLPHLLQLLLEEEMQQYISEGKKYLDNTLYKKYLIRYAAPSEKKNDIPTSQDEEKFSPRHKKIQTDFQKAEVISPFLPAGTIQNTAANPEGAENHISPHSIPEQAAYLLWYYLRTGSLPGNWNLSRIQLRSLWEMLLHDKPALLRTLLSRWKDTATVSRRLTGFLSPALVQTTIEYLTPSAGKQFNRLRLQWSRAIAALPGMSGFEATTLSQHWIACTLLTLQPNRAEDDSLPEKVIFSISRSKGIDPQTLALTLQDDAIRSEIIRFRHREAWEKIIPVHPEKIKAHRSDISPVQEQTAVSSRMMADMLTFFLTHGKLPWWSPETNQPVLRQHYQKLLQQHPVRLRKALRRAAFADKWFTNWQTLLPSPQDTLQAIDPHSPQTSFQLWLHLTRPGLSIPQGWENAAFGEALKELLLTWLLQYPRSGQAPHSFTRNLLQRIAAKYGSPVEPFAAALFEYCEDFSPGIPSLLSETLWISSMEMRADPEALSAKGTENRVHKGTSSSATAHFVAEKNNAVHDTRERAPKEFQAEPGKTGIYSEEKYTNENDPLKAAVQPDPSAGDHFATASFPNPEAAEKRNEEEEKEENKNPAATEKKDNPVKIQKQDLSSLQKTGANNSFSASSQKEKNSFSERENFPTKEAEKKENNTDKQSKRDSPANTNPLLSKAAQAEKESGRNRKNEEDSKADQGKAAAILQKLEILCLYLQSGQVPAALSPAQLIGWLKALNLEAPALTHEKLAPLLKSRQIRLRISREENRHWVYLLLDMLRGNPAFPLALLLRDWEKLHRDMPALSTVLSLPELRNLTIELALQKNATSVLLYMEAVRTYLQALLPAEQHLDLWNNFYEATRSGKNSFSRAFLAAIKLIKEEAALQTKRQEEIEKEKTRPEAEEETEPEEEESSSGLFVDNAGLVLLWPFIGGLFERNGLMKERKFIDEKSACRAVHLLQFLACGKENQPEYQLVLNKVLCGIAGAVPIEESFTLSEQEKEHAQSLLEAVIRQWSIIGNTSVEGLREAFLMRPGKLETETEYFRLHVEKKTYDMLLDQLPWSYSVIRLPWMEKPIHVTWR